MREVKEFFMRITMEPTEGVEGETKPQHKVIVEVRSDELTLMEVGDLLHGMLVAWGFHHESVDELLNPR